jgi:hypothetical protein
MSICHGLPEDVGCTSTQVVGIEPRRQDGDPACRLVLEDLPAFSRSSDPGALTATRLVTNSPTSDQEQDAQRHVGETPPIPGVVSPRSHVRLVKKGRIPLAGFLARSHG